MVSEGSNGTPNPLRLSPEEAEKYKATLAPGWTPPPPKPRSRLFDEKIERLAKAVNMLHEANRRDIMSRHVADVCCRLGWGTVSNVIGDYLGEKGLGLRKVKASSPAVYRIPEGGITPEYLRERGYDI